MCLFTFRGVICKFSVAPAFVLFIFDTLVHTYIFVYVNASQLSLHLITYLYNECLCQRRLLIILTRMLNAIHAHLAGFD